MARDGHGVSAAYFHDPRRAFKSCGVFRQLLQESPDMLALTKIIEKGKRHELLDGLRAVFAVQAFRQLLKKFDGFQRLCLVYQGNGEARMNQYVVTEPGIRQ